MADQNGSWPSRFLSQALPFICSFVVLSGPAYPDQGSTASPKTLTLGSGKQIKVISVSRRQSKTRGVGLYVDYLTELSIRDRSALKPEVDEVWCEFRKRAEEAKAVKVFIIPNDAPIGGALTSFAFARQKDGTWLRQGEVPAECRTDPRSNTSSNNR